MGAAAGGQVRILIWISLHATSDFESGLARDVINACSRPTGLKDAIPSLIFFVNAKRKPLADIFEKEHSVTHTREIDTACRSQGTISCRKKSISRRVSESVCSFHEFLGCGPCPVRFMWACDMLLTTPSHLIV
jgi:hypothetical protein